MVHPGGGSKVPRCRGVWGRGQADRPERTEKSSSSQSLGEQPAHLKMPPAGPAAASKPICLLALNLSGTGRWRLRTGSPRGDRTEQDGKRILCFKTMLLQIKRRPTSAETQALPETRSVHKSPVCLRPQGLHKAQLCQRPPLSGDLSAIPQAAASGQAS